MPTRDEIDAYLGEVLSQHPSVPRDVARKPIGVESSWNQDAVSPKGARGLGQLMPATAKELGVDPNDWRQNVEGSVRYLAQNIDRFGSVELGVGAYHAGPGNVRKAGNKVPDTHDGIMSTKDYVRKITGGSGEEAGGEFTQAADRAPTRRVGKKDRAVLPEWEDAQAFDPVTATAAAPQEEMGSFHRGFAVTWPQTQQLAGGAVAGLADLVGLDSMKQWGLNYYKSKEDEVKALSRETDSFSHVYENGGWAEWLKYGSGYVTGQALESIAAALAGAAVGSMAAPGPGTAAGTFVGFFAKQAVKDGLKTQVEKVMAETVAAQMARGVAADVAQEAALAAGKTVTQGFLRNQAAKVGGATALGAFNFTQEYGGIFPELVEQLGKMGVEMTGEDRARALGAGALAAVVESASDLVGMGKVLKGAGGSTMVRRLAREVPEGMAREGATEGVQTAIERFGAQKELTGEEATREYTDAIALGTLGGGLAGGAASIRGKPAPEATDTVPPLPTPGETTPPAAGTAPGAAPAGPDAPTQPPADVGRPSDGKPFASSAAAHKALRTGNLLSTHEVQQVGDNAFVLRPLPDASESPESAAALDRIHQQGRDDIAAQRDFTPEPEATQPRGENMAGPDAVSEEEVQKRMSAAAKMQDGDVGKPKNGAPFTHRIAAVGAAKRLGLSDTHDVVELGKAQFVLRAKQEAEPDATLPKTESVNQTSLQSGESVNQPAAGGVEFVPAANGGKVRIEQHRKGSNVLNPAADIGAFTYEVRSGEGDTKPLMMVLNKDGKVVGKNSVLNGNESNGTAWIPPNAESAATVRDLLKQRAATIVGSAERKAVDAKIAAAVKGSSAPTATPPVADNTPATAVAPPRQDVGPDAKGWVNQNAQQARDLADKMGITADIEREFAQGKTARQVETALADRIKNVPQDERAGFIVGVRATLGIPSQQAEEGKAEFAVWKKAYDARTATETAPEQTPTGEQSGTPEAPAAEEPARSYASTQVALPKGVAADVIKAGQALIKPEDVHPEKGMEKRPHVTVKYGLHDNAPEAVGKLIADEPPVRAKITGLEVFSPDGKDYDVIVARVDSPDLHRLNAKIKALPNTEDFPDYKPHITLGYVKRGAGEKYAKAKTTLVGREFEVRNLEFSDQDEKITRFPLRGKAEAPAAPPVQAPPETPAIEAQAPKEAPEAPPATTAPAPAPEAPAAPVSAPPKLGKADLEGLTVKFPVQVAETGETVFVEQDAKEALVEARSRKRILQQLLKCVSA